MVGVWSAHLDGFGIKIISPESERSFTLPSDLSTDSSSLNSGYITRDCGKDVFDSHQNTICLKKKQRVASIPTKYFFVEKILDRGKKYFLLPRHYNDTNRLNSHINQ